MERHLAALFFAFTACTALAHADSTVSGSLNINGPLVSCNQSATAVTSISFKCNTFSDPVWGLLSASATPTSVSASAELQTGLGLDVEKWASGEVRFQLSMSGLYMLTGGTGYGLAFWTLGVSNSTAGPGGFGPCTVTLAGMTEICDTAFSGQTHSFYVPYNTPLQLDFTGSGDVGSSGPMAGGPLSMRFTLAGNLEPVAAAPTPEPSAGILTGMGVLAMAGAAAVGRFRSGALSA